MEGVPARKPVPVNRWLPYWAVFQADVQQTLRSWVYRIWVLVSVLAATGYLLYRFGLSHEAGIVQPASRLIADLLRWTLLGSVTLIVVLAAGSISSERGTMADSVLSRGISRHQYFLGKWHSRLTTVLATFLGMAGLLLIATVFLLHEDLSLLGCLMALATVSAVLAAVTTCGVTVSAMCNSTLLGIAVLWVVLYGGGFALSLLPAHYPSPDRALAALPYVLRGHYDPEALGQLMLWCAGLSVAVAIVGLAHFARRDI
jgi:ABC-type transport system involved in multi-copper enzyme maturation permease subunit